jgi:hypothetical protein
MKMSAAIFDRCLIIVPYYLSWISMRTTCCLGFCSVYTFNVWTQLFISKLVLLNKS